MGRLLTHIALGHRFQQEIHQVEKRTTLEGFSFPAFMQKIGTEERQPRTKAQIIELLTHEGEAWAVFLEGLSDEFLAEEVGMMPGLQPATKRVSRCSSHRRSTRCTIAGS